jgi:16S rRNA (guanine(1405)-N(7))-methyltransferase
VNKTQPEALMAQVRSNPKYAAITEDLVLRLSQEALTSGLSGKPAVKFVRNKLHQVGGAYFKRDIDYTEAARTLAELPQQLDAQEVWAFCRTLMQSHASTAERLPIIGDFYTTCLASIAPITSILDLACGLNPLSLPWMPVAANLQYHACDIYLDMLGLIDSFLEHFNITGSASSCDLVSQVPRNRVQVAFLLKSIPCLEQMDKRIATALLTAIKAEHILVSFPIHSLGGRQKGMFAFYRDHFYDLVAGQPWAVLEFEFKTELAFLVTK